MKHLNEYLVNESKTVSQNIHQYGKSWISEWGADYCGNVLSWFIEGVKEGMTKYKSDDAEFQKRCEKCIEEILEKINNDIH